MKRIQELLALSVLLLDVTVGYPHFQDVIPNGDRVPHPCLDNFVWKGLGHKLSEGSGERNPFGEDFDLNGKKWDRCLCERDSDGDGRTNGEELGDPQCIWQPGDLPTEVDGLTHPGVCEPLDSPLCQARNDWDFCDSKEFVCDAVIEPDVQEIRLQYPLTQIPPTETNYFCMTFDLPVEANQSYHLIADRPILNNTLVEHHMIVFGCAPNDPDDNSWKMPEPQSCGMAGSSCQDMIALWGVGHPGTCLPDEYGFRIGLGGYTTVMIQVHWNNPQLRDDHVDAPGMSLFVTPQLRANDAGILSFGTLKIEIPGRTDSYQTEGQCSSRCTQWLPHDVNIDMVTLHMHYLGVESGFSHRSQNGAMQQLVYEERYSYDNPEVYRFQQPLVFKPGDSLSISCTYKSTTKTEPTYYGDGTSDEMCFGFLAYYPKIPDWTYCSSYGTLDLCPKVPALDCDSDAFFNPGTIGERLGAMYRELEDVCNKTGVSPESCPDGCQDTVTRIRNDNPCLLGDTGHYVESRILSRRFMELGENLVHLLHTCDADWTPRRRDNDDDDENDTKNRTAPTRPPVETGQCVFGNDPPGGAAPRPGLGALMVVFALLVYIVTP